MTNNSYLSNEEALFINNQMPGLQVAQVGSKLKNALAGNISFGQKWYLDPVNGNDSSDGLSAQTAFKTLPYAYAKLTADKNEVLYIIGGASPLNLSEAFTWSKSYTHLIGLSGNLRFGGRVRIGHNANFATMFTVSGNGCMIHNIHFQTGRGSTTNLVGVYITGLRNSFTNCHFEAMLNVAESGGTQAWRAVKIGSGAQANGFVSCTFGSWTTVWTSANGALIEYAGDNADTWLDDCVFYINTSSTSMVPLKFAGALSGMYSVISYNNCKFLSMNAAPAVLTNLPSDSGKIFFTNCTGFGYTAYSAASVNVFIANGAANIATGGLAVNVT